MQEWDLLTSVFGKDSQLGAILRNPIMHQLFLTEHMAHELRQGYVAMPAPSEKKGKRGFLFIASYQDEVVSMWFYPNTRFDQTHKKKNNEENYRNYRNQHPAKNERVMEMYNRKQPSEQVKLSILEVFLTDGDLNIHVMDAILLQDNVMVATSFNTRKEEVRKFHAMFAEKAPKNYVYKPEMEINISNNQRNVRKIKDESVKLLTLTDSKKATEPEIVIIKDENEQEQDTLDKNPKQTKRLQKLRKKLLTKIKQDTEMEEKAKEITTTIEKTRSLSPEPRHRRQSPLPTAEKNTKRKQSRSRSRSSHRRRQHKKHHHRRKHHSHRRSSRSKSNSRSRSPDRKKLQSRSRSESSSRSRSPKSKSQSRSRSHSRSRSRSLSKTNHKIANSKFSLQQEKKQENNYASALNSSNWSWWNSNRNWPLPKNYYSNSGSGYDQSKSSNSSGLVNSPAKLNFWECESHWIDYMCHSDYKQTPLHVGQWTLHTVPYFPIWHIPDLPFDKCFPQAEYWVFYRLLTCYGRENSIPNACLKWKSSEDKTVSICFKITPVEKNIPVVYKHYGGLQHPAQYTSRTNGNFCLSLYAGGDFRNPNYIFFALAKLPEDMERSFDEKTNVSTIGQFTWHPREKAWIFDHLLTQDRPRANHISNAIATINQSNGMTWKDLTPFLDCKKQKHSS
jgi:hypothetical protein